MEAQKTVYTDPVQAWGVYNEYMKDSGQVYLLEAPLLPEEVYIVETGRKIEEGR